MTFRITATALAEASEAEARLDFEQPGYGQDFIRLFGIAVREVEANPQMYPRTDDGPDDIETREYFIRRFEYRVIYTLPDPDVIEVIGVVHARRKPGSWTRRLPTID